MSESRVMRRPDSAPSEWVCNARSEHHDMTVGGHVGDTVSVKDLDECYCARCLIDKDPKLMKGSPQPTELYSAEQLEANGLVGLYSRKPDFYIPCGECHKGIPISEPAHVAAARSGDVQVVHFGCLPKERRKTMLVAPYVLVEVSKEKEDGDEASSESLCDEDGGGTEEERLQGDLEERGPEVDDGETVG